MKHLVGLYEARYKISKGLSNSAIGPAVFREGESTYTGSKEQYWFHQYLLYKVSESLLVSFKEWMNQPPYKLVRQITSIRTVAERLEASRKAAEEARKAAEAAESGR